MSEQTSIFENYKKELSKLHDALKDISGADKSIYYDYYINYILKEYSEILGFNRKQIESHLLMLNEPPALDVKTSYTLKELLDAKNEATSWLVPRLYRKAALYILGAAPKSFKSMSMYDLAFAITTSGLYLDAFPCAKGKVLYFQCEEGTPTVINRVVGRGFDESENAIENDLLRFESSFSIKNDLSRLEEILIEYQPDLVIFDSLRGISFQLDVSENSVEFSKYIYALQRLFILHNKTGIIIHHKNKTAGAKGLNSLSGSLSITGATDGVVLMTPEAGENGRVRIETIPRDGVPLSMIIRRERMEGNRWKFVLEQELNVDPDLVKIERKVLRILANNSPNYLDKRDIAKTLGISLTDNNFNYAMDRLLEADVLQCNKNAASGKYEFALPINSPWMAAKSEEGVVIEQPVTHTGAFISIEAEIANQLSSFTTKRDIVEYTKTWDAEFKTKIWQLLVPEEQQRIETIIKEDSLYKEGDIVALKANEEEIYEVEMVEKDELKNIYSYKLKELDSVYYENELISL